MAVYCWGRGIGRSRFWDVAIWGLRTSEYGAKILRKSTPVPLLSTRSQQTTTWEIWRLRFNKVNHSNRNNLTKINSFWDWFTRPSIWMLYGRSFANSRQLHFIPQCVMFCSRIHAVWHVFTKPEQNDSLKKFIRIYSLYRGVS
jgi:hypothetical protein